MKKAILTLSHSISGNGANEASDVVFMFPKLEGEYQT